MIVAPGESRIDRVRVRGRGFDRALAEQCLRRPLANLDLHPPGMSADAIVCIRTLRDPQPGGCGPGGGHLFAPAMWAHAVRERVDAMSRRAARPMYGPVPANAEAVLFADRAELLAALGADWCAGLIATRWWWASLLHAQDLNAAALQLWLDSPRDVPAALARLAERGCGANFVQALPETAVDTLLSGVAHAFALPLRPPGDERASDPVRAPGAADNGRLARLAPAAPPWATQAPEADDARLSSARRVLLGTAVLLARAPAVVRAPSFAGELRRWWRAQQRGESRDGSIHAHEDVVRDEHRPSTPPRSDSVSAAKTAGAMASGQRHPGSVADVHWADDGVLPAYAADPGSSRTAPAQPVRAAPCVASEIAVETRYGGLFYLIGVGLSLGLYGDFTTPATPGIELPIWDFVELVGRRLLRRARRRDAVWGVLADLAGRRRGDPVSSDFEPPRDWAPPPQWRPAAGAARRTRARAVSRPSADAWLDDLVRLIRARLRHALRPPRGSAVGRVLCEHSARVALTPARLDVHFSLLELPIEIRLAGIDRDPGWVPAAGRTVAFHYD